MSASTLTDLDPPAHTPIRRLVNRAFAAQQVADLEPRVRRIANDLIDRFAADGHADFVQQFSFPFPMRVILNVLGAPEDDVLRFKRWADDWITLVSTQQSPEEQAIVVSRLLESQRYWMDLIEEREARPRHGLLSELIRAAREEGSPLTRLQMVNICAILVLAGHETTTNLLGHCLHRVLSLPEQWRLVREAPENIPRAIEETLRADTSVQALMRTTAEPSVLGGVELPKGARLALLFASANHEEAHFPDASRFDILREEPKGHLAFGQGTHFCIGAPLARLEGRIAGIGRPNAFSKLSGNLPRSSS